MKAEQNTYKYSFDFPEGKLFMEGEEIPAEFVEGPNLLGIGRFDTKEEIAEKCKAKNKVSRGTPDTEEDLQAAIDLEEARAKYMEVFGKAPHHKSGVAKLLKAIEDERQ